MVGLTIFCRLYKTPWDHSRTLPVLGVIQFWGKPIILFFSLRRLCSHLSIGPFQLLFNEPWISLQRYLGITSLVSLFPLLPDSLPGFNLMVTLGFFKIILFHTAIFWIHVCNSWFPEVVTALMALRRHIYLFLNITDCFLWRCFEILSNQKQSMMISGFILEGGALFMV